MPETRHNQAVLRASFFPTFWTVSIKWRGSCAVISKNVNADALFKKGKLDQRKRPEKIRLPGVYATAISTRNIAGQANSNGQKRSVILDLPMPCSD